MIFHENRLPADDSHEISCLNCIFEKAATFLNCRLLQIVGGALRDKFLPSYFTCNNIYTAVLDRLTMQPLIEYIKYMYWASTRKNSDFVVCKHQKVQISLRIRAD